MFSVCACLYEWRPCLLCASDCLLKMSFNLFRLVSQTILDVGTFFRRDPGMLSRRAVDEEYVA